MHFSELNLPFRTPRLCLRDFIQNDLSSLLEIANHENFPGYRPFRPQALTEDVIHYLNESIALQKVDAQTQKREVYRLAMILKNEPFRVRGCCVFYGWNVSPVDFDQIGYFIHPDYQGHGYIHEVLRYLLIEYFTQDQNKVAKALVHPKNFKSKNVLEKLGFLNVGEKSIHVYGSLEPRLMYRLSHENFH